MNELIPLTPVLPTHYTLLDYLFASPVVLRAFCKKVLVCIFLGISQNLRWLLVDAWQMLVE